MQLNTIEVIDRHSRPNVLNRVLLRTFFINDGGLIDPYQISGVSIFALPAGTSPSSFLGADSLISPGKNDDAKMFFKPQGDGIVLDSNGTVASAFNTDNYTGAVGPLPDDNFPDSQPCSGVSGVYRIGVGEYCSVLDGIQGSSVSSVNFIPESPPGPFGNIVNSASAAVSYVDIWTVKLVTGSTWKTFINYFELFDGSFYTTTQPMLLTSRNTLMNKQISLGSIVNLKVATNITVNNRDIDDSIKNLMKNVALRNATFRLVKLNSSTGSLPSVVTLLDFLSPQDVDVTSENTLVLTWDTTALTSSPPAGLGSPIGTYAIQVRYNLLKELIVSPLMYFNII
jgi:hypothetical protein